MKIAILSTFYEPYMSGAEQLVKHLLEKLDRSHELFLITARFNRELPQVEKRDGFVIYRVGLGHKTLDKFLYPLLAAWQVRRLKPQVVHAVMESYAGGALVLVKFFYSSSKRLLTLQSGDLDVSQKQKQFWLRIFWRAIHHAPHQITAISHFLAERARKLGVLESKIVVIPNGVDLAEIPAGIGQVPNRVVCVARLSWEKGLDDLINAWGKVVVDVPAAQLQIVGEGPERPKLEKLICELGLVEKVTLLGRLDHHHTLAVLSSASVFVCPSLAEGLGIVFIEAQACGVPVIGTRVGGIPDVIENGVTGLLVSPHDPEALAQALIQLLQDQVLAHKLKQQALKNISRYNWQVIIDQFADLYQKL